MTSTTRHVNSVELNNASLAVLEKSLSAERFGTYLKATDGDRVKAGRLYAWNSAVSGAFYGPLQTLEILLRNAINREMASSFEQDWYDSTEPGFDFGCREKLDLARKKLSLEGRPVTPQNMTATLSFGFWVSLIGTGSFLDEEKTARSDYDMTIWRPAVFRAFPHAGGLRRRVIHKTLYSLLVLRNRIAHHEPVFARDLENDYERILMAASWIEPWKSDWIESHSRVPELLATPRDASGVMF